MKIIFKHQKTNKLVSNLRDSLKDGGIFAVTYLLESAHIPYNSWRYFVSHSSRALAEKFCRSTCESFCRYEIMSFWFRSAFKALGDCFTSSSIQPFIISSMHRSTPGSVLFSESNPGSIWLNIRLHSGTFMTLSLTSFRTDFKLVVIEAMSPTVREEVTAESESSLWPW